MPFSHLALDDAAVSVLNAAFVAACSELGIGPDDTTQRERLAEMICEAAKNGSASVDEMRCEAIRRYHQIGK